MQDNQPLLVDEIECGKRFSLSPAFLRRDRLTKRQIPFIKIGSTVRYSIESVSSAMLAMQQGGTKGKKGAKS